MKRLVIALFLSCLFVQSQAQYSFHLIIRGGEEKTPLAGASATWVEGNYTAVADSNGVANFYSIKAGIQHFIVTHIGFGEKKVMFSFPLDTAQAELILEEEEEEEEEEVIIAATRTSRTIANTPTRVEVISGEELEEKANMKPGDIRMMLNESTGIQTQQTSATSYNSSIRIQGLDGRYTQIVRDGLPLYGGFAGGLGIMQIAPLDLRQVEVIKGSASTLYGGGAIAGLVNLVSKTPGENRELSFMANATSAGGLDLSGFYSQKFKKVGLSFFGSRNTSRAYDPADIGLSAIPEFERYTINPRLFFYGKCTRANAGISYITEDRTGGSMAYIKDNTAGYFERNESQRFTAHFSLAHTLSERADLQIKSSFTSFGRTINIPSYVFDGLQRSSFSEASYNIRGSRMQWILGANVLTDHFSEKAPQPTGPRNCRFTTLGFFALNTWTPHPLLTIETGLRGDGVTDYGFELLPRISAMVRISPKITTRLGGGFGYKTPTIFTEDAERIQFRKIRPVSHANTVNERSFGGNFDINYRTSLGDLGFSINQLFFYTRLDRPLVLLPVQTDYEFVNAGGHIDTRGIETNLKLTYGEFKLFLGYTYADVYNHEAGNRSWFPLTARHRLNNVLMYEKEEKLKMGLEAYYVSRQKLGDGSIGKPYWITGFMVEKLWDKFSVFVNFENFTDTRQTRFDTIYTGTVDQPLFRDIYAPVDGFVINGGIKLKL
ncbi:MAG TPA: TonB-dependent receptor [Flavisolibacter sp.]|nr:TonB-dependent receptor [Flavisolibacter sp.]